ncbi:MAG: ISKra4 family transposase, partial [Richelia sp.]|nr:ISKra4 family transposase [Richelia sp.]
PQQIVNPSDEDRKINRLRLIGKGVWASLAKEPEKVISGAFDEAIFRDRNEQKPFCALVYGNEKQLSLLKKFAKKHNLNFTLFLDIIHVIEYLWKAAFVFSSQTSTQAEALVSKRLQLILEGKSSSVPPVMRRSATLSKLTPQERKPVDTCARYLVNNTKYLKYDDYLKAGFPIPTGVIEGACRHLIKDRMDITGARWSMRGGEAVLPLGSLYISGDWDEYWQFHLQQEHKPNDLALYSSGIPLIKQVIKPRCSTTPPALPIPV